MCWRVRDCVLEAEEVVLQALQVLESVRCVLEGAKDVRHVLKVLEIVVYMLEVANGVRCVPWMVRMQLCILEAVLKFPLWQVSRYSPLACNFASGQAG